MTHHEPFETESEADAAFERLLLRSASADPLPEGRTREAWAKFASASANVALVAAGTPGLGGALHAARRASLKWLAIGALGGGAITAAWLGSRDTATRARIAPTTLPAEPAAAIPPPLQPSTARLPPAQPTLPETNPEGDSPAVRPRSPMLKPLPARRSAALKPSAASERTASSLAAEVAALDAVQKAIAARELSRAVRLVDDYQREFPQGQLAPDADVLAIEALAAEENRAELRVRAERFLTRYPKDPHRARITTLLDR